MENYEINENNRTEEEIQIIKGDEIDIIALIKAIWNDRKTIIYTTIVVMIIGVMIALFSPVKYSASAVLLPQAEGGDMTSGSMGKLGALAGLAGIDMGGMLGGTVTTITPDLYPDILMSYPFLDELLKCSFYFEKESENIVLYDKLFADTISGFGSKVLKYTVRLPWTIKNAITKKSSNIKKSNITDNQNFGLIIMDENLFRVLGAVSEMIYVNVDKQSGLIRVGASMVKEQVAAAQLAQKVVDLLQKYIIDYKTKQVQENLEFIENRYSEIKIEFELKRKEFFDYRDSHRNPVTERTDIYFQELSDAYNLLTNLNISLAEQLEQAKIAVKKETPVFSVIEPVKVPFKKSSPQRMKIMVISLFLGGFLGLIGVFGKMLFGKIKKLW